MFTNHDFWLCADLSWDLISNQDLTMEMCISLELREGHYLFHIMPLYSKGEPNDSGGNEDCVMMYTDDGYWNDLNCDNTLQFICEKKSKWRGLIDWLLLRRRKSSI